MREDRTPRTRATTPGAREREMVTLAVDLAEEQLRAGTASSQVISHYLKLATSREQLEQKKLNLENDLLVAKRETLDSQQRVEELYRDAIVAMRRYSGQDPVEEEEHYED